MRAYWHGEGNWGDILTPLLVERLSGDRPRFSRRGGKLLAAGSILHQARKGDLVWGAGILSPSLAPSPRVARSLDCRAVRGPLTRAILIELGATVPEVYGDPGLLAGRLFDVTRVEVGHELGVVPHYTDLERARALLPEDVLVIDITSGLEPVVQQIASCAIIASSSLHGVVAAEALGRRVVWFKLGEDIWGWPFKFQDHFLATGRIIQPLELSGEADPLAALRSAAVDAAPPPSFDLDALLAACPFATRPLPAH